MLKSSPKCYRLDTHRVKTPEETLTIIKGTISCAGITRVADITGLDRVGIPVFTSIRPAAASGAVTVYTGKGYTPQEAEVSAIMEGVERYSAEPENEKLLCGSFYDLRTSINLLDPNQLILPGIRNYHHQEPLEWVKGYDVTNAADIWVPAEAVFHPYSRANQLFRTNTNGLAVGNIMEEAVVHGLMEVIERDAWSLFEIAKVKGKDLNLDQSKLNEYPLALDLVRRMESSKLSIFAKDITSDIRIPTVAVAIDDEATKDPALLSLGVGTHLIPELATVRALTEAVQSRLTTIHGTREDTVKAEFARRIGYERMKRLNKKWFIPSGEPTELGNMFRYESDDFLEDINHTIVELSRVGLKKVILVNLTRVGVSIPAVRVIVPGLEVYALDKERAGTRLRRFP
ncbi:MAG: YcaO-related McrA-glycine thioamidation protein [Candidatus Methanomethylicus sp.]|nr:YcaO-related McrA-glycine thioamidation protein [Candidatus Methanomethylicus sp.]